MKVFGALGNMIENLKMYRDGFLTSTNSCHEELVRSFEFLQIAEGYLISCFIEVCEVFYRFVGVLCFVWWRCILYVFSW